MTLDDRPAKAPNADKATLRIAGTHRLLPIDAVRAEAWRRDLVTRAREADCPRLAALMSDGSAPAAQNLAAVLDLSSHLAALALKRPDWLETLFDSDATTRIAAIAAMLANLPVADESEGQLMTRLREAKAEAALLIALNDLFGAANVRETTAELTRIAENAVAAALRFCLLDAARRGLLRLNEPGEPERGCGLFILGMGKLGGGELNYSSDIDIVAFFDPAASALVDREAGVETFSRLMRRLVRIVGERTGDGYVFRTDLRLRPDPSAMPLAISVGAAIAYYEMSGRNWERAAMIKARVVAGDRAAGAAFLDELTPFIWRKYLDFATIADIQSMKDRIDRHRGFDGVGVAGHNVKLGPGGIREIEFFAQTQQLIAGGRSPALRLRRTEETLTALAAGNWIAAETADEMSEAYWFLRRVEHAIQMVADEQSHVLPKDEAGLLVIARLLGFVDVVTFSDALVSRLHTVEMRFSQLFQGQQGGYERRSPSLAESAAGVLLGGEDEAAAVARLSALGFQRPTDMARILGRWGEGRYRATRAEATRQHLTRVLPALMGAFAAARDPDAALVVFDAFLERLPAGLQFFSLIASNPRILDLLTLILTSAPWLAKTIARRAHVFDALLDPAFYRELPTRTLLKESLQSFLDDADGYEETLQRLRIFAEEQRFLIGARLLSGAIEGEAAGLAHSDLADVVIAAALSMVSDEFVTHHGTVPGGRMVLLGMGRLGSRELTARSDIDLILLYDHAAKAEESVGAKPLAVSLYYGRLTQRLIAALTAPMGEGVLYEVDFRLRPSGNKGPLATHIEAFRRYQNAQARTWEKMALTRSRPIAGDASLSLDAAAIIRAIVAGPCDRAVISRDVASMRALIDREKPPRGPLDLKLMPGGLIDLEFIAQWAILCGHVPPEWIGMPTSAVLAAVERSPSLRNLNFKVSLHSSMEDFTRVIQLTRLGPEKVRCIDELPQGLGERVAKALDLAEPSLIETSVGDLAAAVRETFGALLPLNEGDVASASAERSPERTV